MKKARKGFAFITAAAMALASLPVLSAGAADATYALGDVDQDGIITGHDSAMVTRALNVEGASLTEEQQALADVNADGVVDQTDADWIHENEVYMIGDVGGTGQDYCTIRSAWYVLYYYSTSSAGRPVELIQKDFEDANIHTGEEEFIAISTNTYEPLQLTQVQYNLMDANGDGEITIRDAFLFLYSDAWSVFNHSSYVLGEGRYDLGTV